MNEHIVNGVWIDKITTVPLKPDDMETVNYITGIYPEHEVNFVDYSEFAKYEELRRYVSEKELNALRDGLLDYVVFRLDI